MDDECLSLTWNNHGATYRRTLSALREEKTLTDVTLACDGQKFSAHKLVLVTCSDYFRSILSDIQCQHPIIYLRGVTGKEMKALINFMYTGQTDIPQKEVPTLLSTAEALQIKGLGVLNASEEEEKTSQPERDRSVVTKKRRSDSSGVFNGAVEEGGRSGTKTVSRENTENILENLYSHHYALLSSPKRKKRDDKLTVNANEFSGIRQPSGPIERSPRKENEDSNTKTIPTSRPSGGVPVLDNLLHNRSITSILAPTLPSMSPAPPSPRNDSFSEDVGNDSRSLLNHGAARQRIPSKRSTPSTSSHSSRPPSIRPETKAASPRALNYSIAGLGGSRINYGAGAPGHMSEDANTVHAETPENFMKVEVKEEALDFSSNTTLSEPPHGDPPGASPSTNSIEEEARMYLDAFARSANLSWQQPPEEHVEPVAATTEERPFACPICQKTFAKAAILKRHHLAHFRPYVCHICTRSFTRREVLAEHLLEHNGADLRMPCPVCGMTIKRKRNLQAHIKVKHPDYYRQKVASKQTIC